MSRFLLQRLLFLIPTLLGVLMVTFLLLYVAPGDPVQAMAGEERDPAVMEYLREKYRLNDPVPLQYVHWVGNVLQGDLPSPLKPPSGCTFHPRCPYAAEICRTAAPVLEQADGHAVSCHRWREIVPPPSPAAAMVGNPTLERLQAAFQHN